jgi:hypothetical protein
MNRLLALSLALLFGVTLLVPAAAEARRVRVVHHGPAGRRTVVVVRPGHPIRRSMHVAVYRRPNVVVRVAPVRFLPLVAWHTVVVERPATDRLAWQDAETLSRDDDWAETVFDSDQRGDKLFLEVVAGRVQFDFAEVVFENGDCQVVDFANNTRGPGVYGLLDFADGRKVDHVRLIARARTDEARVSLLLRK